MTLLLVLLLGAALGYLAGILDFTESKAAKPAGNTVEEPARWVRTRDGWEKTSDWTPPPPVYHPPGNPLALALLQLFVSVGALLAFPARSAAAQSDTACRIVVHKLPRRGSRKLMKQLSLETTASASR